MNIGVTGPRGRLGSALVAQGVLPIEGDIRNKGEMSRACKGFDAIINAAAYTDVDGAESEDEEVREEVVTANVRGPGMLRIAFEGLLIHISTGFVFDGMVGPYDEQGVPNPLNFYAMSKLGGEAASMVRGPTLIVRTLDLYGPRLPDFVWRTRNSLKSGRPVELPTNYFGNPTYVDHLAEALRWLCLKPPEKFSILNVCGDTVMSRFAWGRMIAEAFGYDPALVVPVEKIWGLATRPLRGGLLVDLAQRIGVPIYSPKEGLEALRARNNG